MKRVLVRLAVATGLLLGTMLASAADQRDRRNSAEKKGVRSTSYTKARRTVHTVEVSLPGKGRKYREGRLSVVEVSPGEARVVEFTTLFQNPHAYTHGVKRGWSEGLTRRRLIKKLLEKAPHLRQITFELSKGDADHYEEGVEDLTHDVEHGKAVFVGHLAEGAGRTRPSDWVHAAGRPGEPVAVEATEIYAVLQGTPLSRVKEVVEHPFDWNSVTVTFANTRRVLAQEDARGIEVTKFGLNGKRVDRWQAERLSRNEGQGPIRVQDQSSNESMWKRGTRRMVDALTKLPDANTIIFEFDARNRRYALAAGARVKTKNKRRILRESSLFVQALIDRGYEITKIKDKKRGDWLATVTMERPAAKQ